MRVGFSVGDLVVVQQNVYGATYSSVLCECRVCKRRRVVSKYSLISGRSITHRMCNREFTRWVKETYPEFYRSWVGLKIKSQRDSLENSYVYFVDFCDDLLGMYIKHSKALGKENTSLERKDKSLGYVKGNLAWSTWREQASNRSTTVHWSIIDTKDNIKYEVNSLKKFCVQRRLNYKSLHRAHRSNMAYKNRWRVEKNDIGILSSN